MGTLARPEPCFASVTSTAGTPAPGAHELLLAGSAGSGTTLLLSLSSCTWRLPLDAIMAVLQLLAGWCALVLLLCSVTSPSLGDPEVTPAKDPLRQPS
jgi:hypothetical protein